MPDEENEERYPGAPLQDISLNVLDPDEFVAFLRRHPEDAVSLAMQAVRGPWARDNIPKLFKCKAFGDWLVEMEKKGILFDPISDEQRAGLRRYLNPED